jgi:hypothetical protein
VVKIALTEAAMVQGNCGLAAKRMLETHGVSVARSTIENWMHNTRADEYQTIRDDLAGPIQRKIAVEHEDNAIEASRINRKLWARLDKSIDQIPERDLAGAVRNTTVAMGVSTDKALTARERRVMMKTPDPIRTAAEAIARVGSYGPREQLRFDRPGDRRSGGRGS